MIPIEPDETFQVHLQRVDVVLTFRAMTAREWLAYARRRATAANLNDEAWFDALASMVFDVMVSAEGPIAIDEPGDLLDALTIGELSELSRALPTYATLGYIDRGNSGSRSRLSAAASVNGAAPEAASMSPTTSSPSSSGAEDAPEMAAASAPTDT